MPGTQNAPFTRWQRPSTSCGQPNEPMVGAIVAFKDSVLA
jgi:hypothetical protein